MNTISTDRRNQDKMLRPSLPSVSRSLPLLFLLLLLNSSIVSAVANCYYPNGAIAPQVAPCSDEGGACCPYQWQCLSNGLCSNTAADIMGRYSCTDQTWQSEKCPQICTHGNTATGDEAILQCQDGSYCCDGNRSWDCCSTNGTAFFELPVGNVLTSITATYAPTSWRTVTNSPAPSSEVLPNKGHAKPTPTTTHPTTSPTAVTSLASSSGSASVSSAPTSTVTSKTTSTDAHGGVVTITRTSTAYASSNPSSSSTAQKSSNSRNNNSSNSTLILGLALGIPLALLVIIGSVVGIYCFRRQRRAHSNPGSFTSSFSQNGSSSFFSLFSNNNNRSNRSSSFFSSTGMLQSANYVNLAAGGRAPELDGWPVAATIHSADEKRGLVGSEPMAPQLLDSREASLPAVEAGGRPVSELEGSGPGSWSWSGSGAGAGLFGWAQRTSPQQQQQQQQQQQSRHWLTQYNPWRSSESNSTSTATTGSPASSSGAPSPVSPAVQSAFHENFSAESLSQYQYQQQQQQQQQQQPLPVSSSPPTKIRMPPPRYSFYGGVTGRRMPGIVEEEGEIETEEVQRRDQSQQAQQSQQQSQQQQQQQPVEMWGGEVKRSTRRSQLPSQSHRRSEEWRSNGSFVGGVSSSSSSSRSNPWRASRTSTIAEEDGDDVGNDFDDDIGREGVVPMEGV